MRTLAFQVLELVFGAQRVGCFLVKYRLSSCQCNHDYDFVGQCPVNDDVVRIFGLVDIAVSKRVGMNGMIYMELIFHIVIFCQLRDCKMGGCCK